MDLHITADTIIGITALSSGFIIYYFELRRKINDILENREGILTRTQAEHLTELYLDAIHHHLIVVLRRYMENDYIDHLTAGNVDVIMGAIGRTYEEVVKDNKRQMISTFELRGNLLFEGVLNSIDARPLSAALTAIRSIYEKAIEMREDPDQTRHLVENILLGAKSQGRTVLFAKIASIYRRRR